MAGMTSWRDATPQPVQDDLDKLVLVAIDTAQNLLQKQGEFFPFGVTTSNDGEERLVAAGLELGERPASRAVLDSLYAGVLGTVNGFRAAAFVVDVHTEGSDAIMVQVEHRDGGPALEIFVRYAKKRFRNGIEYGATTAAPGQRHVWLVG
jgi:hypothetical protein